MQLRKKSRTHILLKKGFIEVRQSPADPRAMCIYPTEKVPAYFENDFSAYQKELKYLFEVYTDQEIETLFDLLTRLYAGIDHLEKKTAENRQEPAQRGEAIV